MRNGHAIILLALACSCAKPEPKPEPVPPEDPIVTMYAAAVDRGVSLLDGGFVVSRADDGAASHTGDSLIFSGIALDAWPCDAGAQTEEALIAMLEILNGGLFRHPTIPDDVSLDGALGLYRGVASRVARCPGSRERLAAPFAKHLAFSKDGQLNPSGGGTLVTVFRVVRDAVAYQLGLDERPSAWAVEKLSTTIAGWAALVNATHVAAYRIHLGLLSIETLESAGVPFPGAERDKFCASTRGVDMPTVDHYCGRGDLAGWARGFTYDSWEYRHQRAGWESADGRPGLRTPALDLATGLRKAYGLP